MAEANNGCARRSSCPPIPSSTTRIADLVAQFPETLEICSMQPGRQGKTPQLPASLRCGKS